VSPLVTFEGPEGSGKSTQMDLLRRSLDELGVQAIFTREPGGTEIGEKIRAILHDVANLDMLPETEALLYLAARAQHVRQVLRPAVNHGDLVISDRFSESTLAYQGFGHGLDLQVLGTITEFATGGLVPDLVIYLNLDVEIGLKRKIKDYAGGRGEWNRMDQQSLEFHRRVRQGYLTLALEAPTRWLIVDATRPIEVIHQTILARVTDLLNDGGDANHSPRG